MEGFDQKPVHVNESGSRTRQTLGWRGSREASLKDREGQTRERWKLMTHDASDLSRFAEYPLLEALLQGGPRVGEHIQASLREICAGGDYGALPWFSAAVGPRGSYRQEHALD